MWITVQIGLENAVEMFPISVHDAMMVREVLKVAEEKLECAIEDLRLDSKYLGKGQTVQEAGLKDGAKITAVVPCLQPVAAGIIQSWKEFESCSCAPPDIQQNCEKIRSGQLVISSSALSTGF